MKKIKKRMIKVCIGLVLLIIAIILDKTVLEDLAWYFRIIPYLPAYIVSGFDVIRKAAMNISKGQVFDENFLMLIATIGAFVVQEYIEAVAVMIFYQVGEIFQSYAMFRSRRSISSLMDIRPDYANLVTDEGTNEVAPESVAIGDIILIKPGERIPLDGIVIEGASSVDTKALTGESVPRDYAVGDEVISGCVNLSAALKVRVTKPFGESTVAKVLDLVENAYEKKAKSENFITKFARYYTPAVVIGALLLAVIPPLIIGPGKEVFMDWIFRALTCLVVSCPCALVISVPLSFFGGIGGASKAGLLIKGGNYIEALAALETVVFDKTGTLTKGVFKVTGIYDNTIPENELLKYAAAAEINSNHPIAISLREALGESIDPADASDCRETAGHGVNAQCYGHDILCGNAKLMEANGIDYVPCNEVGTVVYTAIDKIFAGSILISDEIKDDSRDAIKLIKDCGVKKTIMLTGDSDAVGEMIAGELGLDEVHCRLLPQDKVSHFEEIMSRTSKGFHTAYVGDGINDAPVLAMADVGIAMGGMGQDAAIEAADVVIMKDEPSRIAFAIRLARRTMGIVKANIIMSLAVKIAVLMISAIGFLGKNAMWLAVFADVGVCVLAVLNAMRALNIRRLGK